MEVFKKECTVKIEPFIVELCGAQSLQELTLKMKRRTYKL